MVGRLLEPNDLSRTSSELNMVFNAPIKNIPEGCLVILDNDHRYLEGQVPNRYYQTSWRNISYFQTFENMYLRHHPEKKLNSRIS